MPSLASPRPMRLICLSPSRSGTHALYEALGLLGYQPYHFIETLKQGISHQKLARELLDAWQSGTVKPYSRGDFDKWFGNYDALTEVPAYAVPQMVAAYPEAKFLLLERSPKSWAKSFQEAVIPEARRAGQFPANFLKLMDAGFREFNDMFYIIGHEVSGGAFDGPGGFENCIRWYEEHVKRVKDLVPTERLYVVHLEKGFGWGDLCRILKVADPCKPWPRRNNAKELKALLKPHIARATTRAVTKAAAVGVVITLLLVYITNSK